LEAGYFVLGNILVIGDQLQLHASLYDASGELEAIAEGSAEGESDQLFELVDAVAAELLLASGGESRPGVTHIAAVTTNSLEALKEYLQGERALRAGQYQEATEALRRAVEVDPTFALAWYRLSVAYEWLTRNDLIRQAAEEAVRHSSRLSEHDKLLLEAAVAARRGGAREAEQLYSNIVGSYPGDVEAWFQLGEILFPYGPLTGRPIAGSQEAFERVLFYEPDHVNALIHLVRIEARNRNLARLDSLVDRFLELNRDADRAIEMRAIRAFAAGDAVERERVLAELPRAADIPLLTTIGFVPVMTDDIASGDRLSQILTEPSRSPQMRGLGHVQRAFSALTQGRWRDAKEEIVQAARFDPTRATEHGAYLTLLPFTPASDIEVEAARARLEGLDPDTIRPSEHPSGNVSAHNNAHHLLRGYLLGMLNVRLGDEESAARYASEIETFESPVEGASFPEDLSLAVQAEVRWRRGETTEALALLERAPMQRYYQTAITSVFFSESLPRYRRAVLLEEVGRLEEALRWYGSFAEVSRYDVVFLAPSHLRRAEIHDRRGQTDEAVRHYARFIELWAGADPELRPLVEGAEARLAELSGEPARR
jgi:tetratricopeptide (TPR) repeat protein